MRRLRLFSIDLRWSLVLIGVLLVIVILLLGLPVEKGSRQPVELGRSLAPSGSEATSVPATGTVVLAPSSTPSPDDPEEQTQGSAATTTPIPAGTPAPAPVSATATSSPESLSEQPTESTPQPEDILASAVETALANGEVLDESGNVLQITPGNYYLVYEVARDNPAEELYSIFYSENDGFMLFVPGRPFGETRNAAEERLLRLLGQYRNEACALAVEVVIPRWGDPAYAGQTLSLSFCVGK